MRLSSLSVLVWIAASGCDAGVVVFEASDPAEPTPPVSSYPDDGGAPAPAETPTFRPTIQQDLVRAGCLNCHGGSTVPMSLVRSPAADAEWESNHEEVVARVGGAGESLLVAKALGAGGHGVFLTSGDATTQRWRRWVAAGAPLDAEAAPPPDPPPPVDGSDAGTTEPPPPGTSAVTWVGDVEPIIFDGGCTNCHGDRGGYSLETLSDAMGAGSDSVPNVIPGDANSQLVVYARRGHHGLGYRDALTIMAWVVDWNARSE